MAFFPLNIHWISLLRCLRWLDEYSIFRNIGFGALVTVEATWPSFVGPELRHRYLDAMTARFRVVGRTYPTEPIPARHRRDICPEFVCFRISYQRLLQIRWYFRLRPFFRWFKFHLYFTVFDYIGSFKQLRINLEPVTSLAIWFKDDLRTETINRPLDQSHTTRWKLCACASPAA